MDKNIIDIHNSILQFFENEENNLPYIEKQIRDLHKIYDDKLIPHRLKQYILSEIGELSEKCDMIKSKQNLNFYILETTFLLEDYKKELNKSVQVNFMGGKSDVDTTKVDEICENFYQVIQKIYPIHYKKLKKVNTCPSCHSSNVTVVIDSTNTLACVYCGDEKDMINLTFSYNDTDRINITSRYTYERRVHFRECINQFQGKQNSTIKQTVYDLLYEQLELYRLVREGDLPKNIKYEKGIKIPYFYIFERNWVC